MGAGAMVVTGGPGPRQTEAGQPRRSGLADALINDNMQNRAMDMKPQEKRSV
jgi:hypothetical protein